MPVEAKKEIELEIAHVLFLDIVGYSKLSINEQHARIQELNEIVRDDDSGVQIATVYALRKEPEKVFEWLEHAWATHDGGVIELLTDPFLRAYKDDPRFIAFAQKIGMMPKSVGNP